MHDHRIGREPSSRLNASDLQLFASGTYLSQFRGICSSWKALSVAFPDCIACLNRRAFSLLRARNDANSSFEAADGADEAELLLLPFVLKLCFAPASAATSAAVTDNPSLYAAADTHAQHITINRIQSY
jgi:hypothetical protein